MTRLKDKTSSDPAKNLARLAAYLEKLPADYAQFEMANFVDGANPEKLPGYVQQNGSVASCGTAACAVGHGPAAHMFFNDAEVAELLNPTVDGHQTHWFDYAERVFGTKFSTEEFEWMFGSSWSRIDNTVHGAAKRIRYFLANGVPEGFEDSSEGDEFVSLYQ